MSLGIIGAILMTMASVLWSFLSEVVPVNRGWLVDFTRLAANAGTGLALGLLISRLKKLSITDPLTEVYNRGYFIPQLKKHLALAKRHSTPVSLVLIDLDRFKEHNDNLGHIGGDRLLRLVAAELRSMVRSSDVVARYGGDEFVVLLPHTDAKGAVCLMQRVKTSVCEHVLQNANVTFSAGVAAYPDDGETADSLLLRADQALYAAKNQRNNILSYNSNAIPANEC